MPVPVLITDLSATPSSNSPAGTETPSSTDDYLRTLSAFVKQNYDKGVTNAAAAAAAQAKADAAFPANSLPSGTRLLFQQSAAPTGWTKDTTHNDKALRIVSGTAGSGGTHAFTTVFANRGVSGSVGYTALTIAQMPSHSHGMNGAANTANGTQQVSFMGNAVSLVKPTNAEGGNEGHTHSFSGTAIDMSVQYVDVIVAVKI